MAIPSLPQALRKIQQDAVARQHRPLLHPLLRVVALGPMTMLVGVPMTTASPMKVLVGTVVGIGSPMEILHLLPQHPFQRQNVALGTMRTCVLTVVNIALQAPAIV